MLMFHMEGTVLTTELQATFCEQWQVGWLAFVQVLLKMTDKFIWKEIS